MNRLSSATSRLRAVVLWSLCLGLEAAEPRSLDGVYDVSAPGQPERGIFARFAIHGTGTDGFTINGVFQAWEGTGRFDGRSGFYEWNDANGNTGRTTIEIQDDAALKGHILGPNVDFWYRAQRMPVPASMSDPPESDPTRAAADAGLKREIRLLASGAPVTDAAANLAGERLLLVFRWLVALASAGCYEEAHVAAGRLNRKLPDADSVTAIALGLGRAGLIDEARKILRFVPPDEAAGAMSTMVRILIEANRFDEAKAEARRIPTEFERYRELAVLVKAMTEAGRIDDAASVVEEMTGSQGAMFARTAAETLDLARVRTGQTADVLAVARKESAPRLREMRIKAIALELAKLGKVEEAFALEPELEGPSDRSQVRMEAVRSLTKANRPDEALALARKIENDAQRAMALVGVAAGFAQSNRITESEKLVHEAVTAANAVTPERTRAYTLNRLATVLASAGFITQAADLLKDAKDAHERGWTLLAMAEQEAKAGRFDEALDLCERIPPGLGQRSTGITHVVTAAATAGRTLPRVSSIGVTPPVPGDRSAVVEGLAAAGKVDAALAIAHGITDLTASDSAYLFVSVALTRAKDFAKARETADRCVNPEYRLSAYLQILTLLAMERNPVLKQKRGNAGTLF